MIITKDMLIGDVLDIDVGCAEYFFEIGMHCLGCPSAQMESIAEAAIKLNGVFEAAEKAAQQYLENVERKCREREEAAENKCAYLEAKAKEVVDERWNELSTKLEEFYRTHEGIRELLTMTKIGI